MSTYFDALETQDSVSREKRLFSALRAMLAHAQENSLAWASILKDIQPEDISSRHDLRRLPVTRKADLVLLQQQARDRGEDPFGGIATVGYGRAMHRVFASPGPIYEPQGGGEDFWRVARALYAAGFRAGDLVHNTFSYHMTPGAFLMEAGALALGCTVFPAGTGQTEQQLQAIADLKPTAYVGTPSFLRVLIEKIEESGKPVVTFHKALLSGEACPPGLTAWFADHGVQTYQFYGTADAGLIAYETASREGLVVDEGVILEILEPGGTQPMVEGEVGEIVVTILNQDYPLIRFATGDLSMVLPGHCNSGRTNMRIAGWMGRADQATKVRGMFVRPEQIRSLVERFDEVARARLVVSGSMGKDQSTLLVEAQESSGLRSRLETAFREVTSLRCEVHFVAPDNLSDDRVIEDTRKLR